MQVIRLIAPALLLMTACAGAPGDRGAQEAPSRPIRGGVAEFHLTYYDGYDLKGGLLVGTTDDSFVIDGRMLKSMNVQLKKVHACGKPGEYGTFDAYLSGGPRPEDVVGIRKGDWYRTNIHFFLWDDKETGIGPECFDAELVVLASGWSTVATVPIHVERTHDPPTPPLGDPAKPHIPTVDGGAP